MGTELEYIKGQTPIDEGEKEELKIKTIFTWGSKNLAAQSETRTKYLSAIYKADNVNIKPLLEFAKT